MTAGEVWRRTDAVLWVEVQNPAVEGSGWRLVVPLADPSDAPDAPPLVVPAGRWRARVHLLTGVPQRSLGAPVDRLPEPDLAALQAAGRAVLGGDLTDRPPRSTPHPGDTTRLDRAADRRSHVE